ncbi:glycogen debranching enzyme GlgX [Egibacter rhizosphaerae]|uniref:Glycogen debranching enzyme GlgX n=1 Tax=Egibacter rhizosphaerae TaxID=1670831 RepID=A0A411YAK7_9ACTN|nr:glycogen debranching protein GlgX [Egibacter rhizosphaerae]QBI18212.1 glycogen debranching enzyme GlgX [Egibacter rhizosphaerae]
MHHWPGRPYPLGATWDGTGTNFSLFSEHAEEVELCLFGARGKERRITMADRTAYNFHCYLPGVGPGQRYGFRVHGPWEPEAGHRFNPDKLLIDPYAKAIDGGVDWDESVFGYRMGEDDRVRDDRDSAPHVPRAIVANPYFDWGEDRHPLTPWTDTVIYETHVRGLTMQHPDVEPELRGTYAGLASPPVLEHLIDLGVTAVELQPVHHFVHDHFLHEHGLRNYWGYNSIGFFAPHDEYAAWRHTDGQVQEFKQMVKELHAAGLEVILDVVYNHTAEGDHMGPTLSFRGIDNLAYYRVVEDEPRYYMDYTGTGNSLNVRHPHVLQLIMDSLRYWILEMRVDGFRFDLAAALARELHDVDRLSSFFDIIQQDPVISQTKLIAEPWDVGEGGYQVGNFPVLWTEWNGKYRDTIRDFWRGDSAVLGETATRLSGSSDLYEHTGRRPNASINFITAHDGFTLRDLVSYNEKHNEANLADPDSGESHNRSWNHGVEGPTDDEDVNALRQRQQRNFLATLFISQGVPMLLGGDEFGRSQRGNNNTYCQDNELAWYDWSWLDPTDADEPNEAAGGMTPGEQRSLYQFTRTLIHLRRQHSVFRRQQFFRGREGTSEGSRRGPIGMVDLDWLRPDASAMTDEDWDTARLTALMFFLNGRALPTRDDRGRRVLDESFLVLCNADAVDVTFRVPSSRYGERWRVLLDTAMLREADGWLLGAGDEREVTNRSLVVLRRLDDAAEVGARPR